MSQVIDLLTGATSSAAPASLTAVGTGVRIPVSGCDSATILVHNTAGTGTVSAIVRLWGFCSQKGRWYDLGALNGGDAIPETSSAEAIAYAEGIAGLRPFTHLYAELGTLTGTGTAISVSAACTPGSSASSV